MKNIGKQLFLIYLFIFLSQLAWSQSVYIDTGVASYYAKEFHGKKTASGEKYDMNKLTAAHPSLPFNTKVKVTYLKTNQSVVVRINDRGPHTKKRIIDLSKAAAARIGLVQAGVGTVRIEVISADTLNPTNKAPVDPKSPDPSTELKTGKFYTPDKKEVSLKGYFIQCASLSDYQKIVEKTNSLKKQGYKSLFIEAAIINKKKVYRLLIGTFQTKQSAEKELALLKKKGHSGFVKSIN